MSAIPTLPQKRLPFGDLAPVLRPIIERFARDLALPAQARILEAGSSGGLLTALLSETDLAPQIAVVDFADPSPDTLESAIARSAHAPWRAHFLNVPVHHLARQAVYHLVLTWSLLRDSRAVQAVHQLQRRPGWLMAFHDPPDAPGATPLAFHLHPHQPLASAAYAVSGGRQPKSASLWTSRP